MYAQNIFFEIYLFHPCLNNLQTYIDDIIKKDDKIFLRRMSICMNWIEKKSFYIFILINMILWVAVESLRNIISRDSMEAIVWGNLVSFGTNKHPPLSGWLAGGAFHLFQEHNIAIYLLGAVCISVSLIYIYKLAKFFLDEKKQFAPL